MADLSAPTVYQSPPDSPHRRGPEVAHAPGERSGAPIAGSPGFNPLRAFLNLFSSVWLGVVLLSLLFIYSSIGSSGVPTHWDILNPAHWRSIRQMPWLEMTEFEWFHWWPFDLLIALICINLVVATLRRIPLNVLNLGVWMIHSGIILLALGSVWYFSTKIEGDAPVARRRLIIQAPGAEPASMTATPGSTLTVGSGENRYALQVVNIDPNWELLSGSARGRRAYKVSVLVQGQGGTFIRDLIAGEPSMTTDLVATQDPTRPFDRAINVLGKPLVDEALKLALEYDPQRWFYLADSRALYLREFGSTQWIARPIRGLPRYNDYIAQPLDVWFDGEGARLTPDPIDVAVPAVDPNDPLAGVTFRISRYLRYAGLEERWRHDPSGSINPRATVSISAASGERERFDLVAFDARRATALADSQGRPTMLFTFATSQADLEQLRTRVDPVLRFTFPATGQTIEEPITAALTSDPNLPFKPIAGTEYAYRVEGLQDGLQINQRELSLAIVQIKGPQRTFTRWVFDDPAFNRDLAMTGDAVSQHQADIEKDANIEATYRRGALPPAPIVLAAGPAENDLSLIVTRSVGAPELRSITPGDSVEIAPGVTLAIDRYAPRSIEETRPLVIPREQRDRNTGEFMSMVHIDSLRDLHGRALWLPYHHYAFADPLEVLHRFPHRPTLFEFNGRTYEMMFGRQRRPLPSPVALDDFAVDTHIGGFTGDTSSILDWKSVIRFQGEDGQWLPPQDVRVNKPSEFRGFSFFQAQWDPPDPPRSASDLGSAGLNYTVLGVGNRNGVNVQLAGCIIAVIGMLFAFYAKPLIKRRRQQRVYSQARSHDGATAASIAIVMLAAMGIGGAARAQQATAQPAAAQPDPASPQPAAASLAFAQQVDLTALGQIAVHTEGRVKSLDSFARAAMQHVSGSHRINEQTPTFTYFDLMLRPEAYRDQDIIYIKNKIIRADVARALQAASAPGFDAQRHDRFMRTGLLSGTLISQPASREVLERLSADVLRTARFVGEISRAMRVMNPDALRQGLAIVPPPPPRGFDEPWLAPDELAMLGETAPLDAAVRTQIVDHWLRFVEGWKAHDAAAVNAAAAQLARILPAINPEVYPETRRLAWESWYFRMHNMTWVWIFYALSMVPLLLSVVFRWRAAHWIGMLMFLTAFGFHSFAVMLRWYVAQRWPNSNMFEAITTAAWFGACLALLLEALVARGKPMRSLFALGASVAGMCAMMAVKMYPLELNADIRNMMPVLNDIWLYIHTNVIIFSYCLIFIAAVTAFMYLVYRGVLLVRGRSGIAEYARVGGAGSLILTRPDGTSSIDETRSTLGQVLDGTTMVVMEMSFILLWAGLVMGAIWADHSWGRPWGWDPKEVFALNTFLVFLVLVHGRMKVKDKGLWTAVLALVGASVMLFNWIIINFAISGLHSYA